MSDAPLTTNSYLPSPPVGRSDLLNFLKALGIDAITIDHPPLFTVKDSRTFENQSPGAPTKNLFLKDAKGQLWLICAHADSVIDLKSLPKLIGSARLSFGSPQLMQEVLGVIPGSVTLFAIINDPEHRVRLVLDTALLKHPFVHFHPMRNDATTCLPQQGLQTFLSALSRKPLVVDFQAKIIIPDCKIAPQAPHYAQETHHDLDTQ